MVAKIKTNDHGDCIYTEQDAIDLLYTNPDFDISKLFFESPKQFNDTVKDLGLDFPKINKVQYNKINVLQWLLEKCQNEEERFRVQTEYDLFEKKNFIKVLQFLIYFVDTLRANNVVWGVGRGSSVASFCLFLIGVHKINPMLYNLDHREFLR
jgi:DNA polymerase III alpha subunit